MPTDARLKPELCNCLAVRQAARHVTQFYDRFLAPARLRTTQFSVLARLQRLGPMTISALAAQDFAVPQPIVYCADEGVAGTAFFVMAHVEGRVFWEPQMPASDPAERARVYDAMNATLARLHTFDPAAIGLSDYGRGENYVARQIERWSKQYRASETGQIEEMERLIAWLPDHVPPAQAPRVVHGDYRLDNMIVAPDAARVGAAEAWTPAFRRTCNAASTSAKRRLGRGPESGL